MLITGKINQLVTANIALGCEPLILVNQTANEIYIRIQGFLDFEETAESIFELTDKGFELKYLNFEAPITLTLAAGQQIKTVTQVVPTGDFQVFLLWQVPQIN